MKNWQKERNYRKTTGEKGTTYYINVDGQDVEVSEEVYLAYAQMDRRDRYVETERDKDRVFSLDSFEDEEQTPKIIVSEYSPSAEEVLIEEETEQEHLAQLARLRIAMGKLDEEDRNLVNALYYEGLSTRQYAVVLGITQPAVMKRKQEILKKLKNIFENSEN